MANFETCEVIRWAGLWRSRNKLDGLTEHLLFENCLPKLFTTQREAKAWIYTEYGYFRNRPDLRAEPHGWMLPRPVKVKISLDDKSKL